MWEESQVRQFADQDVSGDITEYRAKVTEEHPDIALPVFRVAQHMVKRDGYYILSQSVCTIGKLVRVEGVRKGSIVANGGGFWGDFLYGGKTQAR